MKKKISILLVAILILSQSTAFQLSFTQNDGAYAHDSNNQVRNPDWMSLLPKSLLLSELSIPGTHDSMTYNSGLIYGGDTAQCQALSLEDQLLSGIRALDIRCVHYKNLSTGVDTFAIYHGAFYQGSNFDDVLSTVSTFLNAHPGETVLMRVKEEDPSMDMLPGFSLTGTPFNETFESYANKYSDVIWVPGDPFVMPKLRDVRGKIVILQDFDDKYSYGPNKDKNFGILWDTLDIQDAYNVTNATMYDKWTAINTQMTHTNISGYNEKLYVNYLSGTGVPMTLPYFVASGHFGSSTDAPQLWTGYFDQDSVIEAAVKALLNLMNWDYDGYYFDKGRWPEFPREVKTVSINELKEVVSWVTDTVWKWIDALTGFGWAKETRKVIDLVEIPVEYSFTLINYEGMNRLTESHLNNYDRVGLIMADFPGPSLIGGVIHMNPWRDIPNINAQNSGAHIQIYSGESASLYASFTDDDDTNNHAAKIDWGDSTIDEPAQLIENTASIPGTVEGSHIYFIPGAYTVTVSVTDDENGIGDDIFFVDVLPLPIDITIRGVINPKSSGSIQVISFGKTDYDVSSVVIDSVVLGPHGAHVYQSATDDVNGDGILDLILHFRTKEVGLKTNDAELIFAGRNLEGICFKGIAPIKILTPKK